jgi:hypothetical protein
LVAMTNAPRSAETFAGFRVRDELVLTGHFPPGTHVFPADAGAVGELQIAIQVALREYHVVLPDEIRRLREEAERTASTFEECLQRTAQKPFALTELRAFHAKRRPPFDRAHAAMQSVVDGAELSRLAETFGLSVDSLRRGIHATERDGTLLVSTMKQATLAILARRLDGLRELGAPDVIIEDARRSAQRCLEWDFPVAVELGHIVPDAMYRAAMVEDAALLFRDGPPLLPVDVMPLVLLAAQCCVDPAAHAIDLPSAGDVAWQSFDEEADEASSEPPTDLPEGAIVAIPALQDARGAVEALELVYLEPSSPLAALAPAGALLRVTMPEPSED